MIWMGGPATSTKISRVGRAQRLHRVPLPRSQFLTAELVVVVVARCSRLFCKPSQPAQPGQASPFCGRPPNPPTP